MEKRDLSLGQLINLSFGFFGVQIAYALQSANISRIFATLGADPHKLSLFWILPPLMGMIVQPLIGKYSDKTWCKLGRRKPYLLVGAIVAVAVMALLPNAGSLGLSASYVILGLNAAMWFGLFALMFLDTSINVAMQPFKMMVGDMVNEKQKGLAYSIQSFLCNAGSLVGYLFPIFFTWIGISNVADPGIVPDSVIWSFYIGAAILIVCVLYTFITVKEMNPQEYAAFHGIREEKKEEKKQENFITLLLHAPKTFWTVGLVQFFCWAAFMYMWTYSNGALAEQIFHAPTILNELGAEVLDTASKEYQNAGDWVGVVFAVQAIGSLLWAMVLPSFKSHKVAYIVSLLLGAVGFISILFVKSQYVFAGISANEYVAMGESVFVEGAHSHIAILLNNCSVISGKYVLFISYLLIGCAWAAMLALPFTILTNSLKGNNMGFYLGLFNCTICLPQIIAAALGGVILQHICGGSQVMMLVVAGVLLILGAASVLIIREKKE